MTTKIAVLGTLGVSILALWASEWFRRNGPDRSRDARPEDYKSADVAHAGDICDIDPD